MAPTNTDFLILINQSIILQQEFQAQNIRHNSAYFVLNRRKCVLFQSNMRWK